MCQCLFVDKDDPNVRAEPQSYACLLAAARSLTFGERADKLLDPRTVRTRITVIKEPLDVFTNQASASARSMWLHSAPPSLRDGAPHPDAQLRFQTPGCPVCNAPRPRAQACSYSSVRFTKLANLDVLLYE